jgi:hypothetical protein
MRTIRQLAFFEHDGDLEYVRAAHSIHIDHRAFSSAARKAIALPASVATGKFAARTAVFIDTPPEEA